MARGAGDKAAGRRVVPLQRKTSRPCGCDSDQGLACPSGNDVDTGVATARILRGPHY